MWQSIENFVTRLGVRSSENTILMDVICERPLIAISMPQA